MSNLYAHFALLKIIKNETIAKYVKKLIQKVL